MGTPLDARVLGETLKRTIKAYDSKATDNIYLTSYIIPTGYILPTIKEIVMEEIIRLKLIIWEMGNTK